MHFWRWLMFGIARSLFIALVASAIIVTLARLYYAV